MKDFTGFVRETTFGREIPKLVPLKISEVPGAKMFESRFTVQAQFACPCCGKGLTVEVGFTDRELPDLGPHGGNVG